MRYEKHLKVLTDLVDRDHARLVKVLCDLRALCERESYSSAAKVFREFRILQERHLGSEDDALQMLVASGTCPPNLVQRVASEHVQLKQRMEATWWSISSSDHRNIEHCISNLIKAIDAHVRLEKEALLPALITGLNDRQQVARTAHNLVD